VCTEPASVLRLLQSVKKTSTNAPNLLAEKQVELRAEHKYKKKQLAVLQMLFSLCDTDMGISDTVGVELHA
jgi:hypothetical protein